MTYTELIFSMFRKATPWMFAWPLVLMMMVGEKIEWEDNSNNMTFGIGVLLTCFYWVASVSALSLLFVT